MLPFTVIFSLCALSKLFIEFISTIFTFSQAATELLDDEAHSDRVSFAFPLVRPDRTL